MSAVVSFPQAKKPSVFEGAKPFVIIGGGGALLGGLFFGAKGAIVLGVGAPIVFVALIASALKGMT